MSMDKLVHLVSTTFDLCNTSKYFKIPIIHTDSMLDTVYTFFEFFS